MDKGITLPNAQWRPYTEAEVAALDELDPGVLVWILYGWPADATHYRQIRPFLERRKPRLLFRPYDPAIPLIDPKVWAMRCSLMVGRLGLEGELIPDNERNLKVENGSENWQAHIDWLRAFIVEFRRLRPGTPVHLGALSPSGYYTDGFKAYDAAGLYNLFDVSDAHKYAPWQQLPPAPRALSITEFNNVSPGKFFTEHQSLARDCSWFILGGEADQQSHDLLRQRDNYNSFRGWKQEVPVNYTSPNHDGPRPDTVGIALHATLGGSPTPQTEFDATVSWFNNPASDCSSHALCGPARQLWYPVRPGFIAWHVRGENREWLGIEMVKSKLSDPILPEVLDLAAEQAAKWCIEYNLPVRWSTTNGLAEHRELPGNDHRDVGGPFDRADFLSRVMSYYVKQPTVTPSQRLELLDHLNVMWGESLAAAIAANPNESERAIHERIIAIKNLMGVN